MDRLQELRTEIDRIDAALAGLFQERMTVAAEIAAQKQARGLPVRDPERERAMLEKLPARMPDPALRPYYARLQDCLLELSRAYQTALLPRADADEARIFTDYPVVIKRGALARAGELFCLDRRVFLVTDSGVPAAYVKALAAQCAHHTIFTLPQGEQSKSLEQLANVWEAMLRHGLTRQDCVLAVGGGKVGDLAGFAAACFMRGVDFYNVPTTLLAMADAAVGGKTAVNLAGTKNPIGAFWRPKAVLMDPEVLGTLPARQMSNGMAEILKLGLTLDPSLFARFEDPAGPGDLEALITRAVALKQSVVEQDEREAGLRRVLNFGHTLGHGIEAVQSGRGALLHGECVALGMLPLCGPAVRARLLPVLEGLELPTTVSVDMEAVLAAVAHDKKAGADGIEVVTVPELGRWQLEKMTLSQLRERLQTLLPQGGIQNA